MRIERLRSQFDVDLGWRFFPLHPETPDAGQTLDSLFAGRGYDLDAMHEGMKARMEAEGLEYNRRTHTYNSRLAQELAKWADSLEGFGEIHQALYRAYFVDGRNLADVEVLVAIAESVGLNGEDARRVLADRSFREEVDADWALARTYGITGVPTFVAGGRGVVGAQPVEALERLVVEAGAGRRKT